MDVDSDTKERERERERGFFRNSALFTVDQTAVQTSGDILLSHHKRLHPCTL